MKTCFLRSKLLLASFILVPGILITHSLSVSAMMSLSVPPWVLATATNGGPYCEGETIELFSGPDGEVSYAWSGPDGYLNEPTVYTVSQSFNGLITSGTATWTDNSTVPGWYSQRTGSGTTYLASDGSANTGNLYSYGTGTDTDRALGTVGSGNAAAGSFAHGYRFQNPSTQPITKILVSYTMEQWRNSAGIAQTLAFFYKTSAVAFTALDPNNNGAWTSVSALDAISPVTGGVAGALNGNLLANQVVHNQVSIGSITLMPGHYIMLKWDDPDHGGSDHGLSIDDVTITFTTSGEQNPTRPMSTSLMGGIYTVTVTDAALNTTTATTNVVVDTEPVAVAGSYGPACTNDPNINLMGSPPGGTWSGPGVVGGNQFDPNAGTQTITYTVTSGACSDSDQTMITVNPCLMAPEMRFVLLDDNGVQNGQSPYTCTSQSDCDDNIICFGLQYTPDITGTLTSYSAGFTMPCIGGLDPVISQQSCVQTTTSDAQNACAGFNLMQWSFSGATPGTILVTQSVPKIIHQVCFTIPNVGSVALSLFPPGAPDAISTSLDVPGNDTFELPAFIPFSFDSSLYCGILPVKYLYFDASKFGEYVSQLDWVTSQEFNNHYFEVQRSNDKGRNFTTIGTVDAVENPTAVNPYQFFDKKARPGVNYYRLKQVDRDGKFQYSPVRTVTFSSNTFSMKAFPNPTADILNVYVSHAAEGGIIEMVDIAGRLVRSVEFIDGDSSHELDVNGLTPGVYTLMVTSGEERLLDKIVIMQ